MKREYKKPVAELVRFELNEAIAACAEDVTQNSHDKGCVKKDYTDPDLWEWLFTQDSCGEPTRGYCYYSVSDSGLNVFDS